mgnify:FL=1
MTREEELRLAREEHDREAEWENRPRFHERHPNLPILLSLIALAASILAPVIREFLARMT